MLALELSKNERLRMLIQCSVLSSLDNLFHPMHSTATYLLHKIARLSSTTKGENGLRNLKKKKKQKKKKLRQRGANKNGPASAQSASVRTRTLQLNHTMHRVCANFFAKPQRTRNPLSGRAINQFLRITQSNRCSHEFSTRRATR